MPAANFFTRFGLFVRRSFLDREQCARLCAEMRAAPREPATVRGRGAEYVVDPSRRSVLLAEMPADGYALVEGLLLAVRPAVESHFEIRLEGCQPLQFLTYRTGDFYQVHRDSAHEPEAADFPRRRRISAVIHLNATPDYGGGSLTFYGLMGDVRARSVGFSLEAEAGLLVAFRSDLAHEVTPVSHGERYSIATWYY
jgi:predicted 2-oxoglutarate/Fe(II)-dependent dioxygenase YbiX